MHAVAPPDQTVWWDAESVTSDVLAALRLTPTDVDAQRILRLVDVAGEMINDYLDECVSSTPPVTAVRDNAIRSLVRELYGRRDIPVIGPNGTRVERADVGVDEGRIEDILSSLGAKKARWGVA